MNAPLPTRDQTRLAIIGLGYVGLPLAVAFGKKLTTLGFDINPQRVAELERHHDQTLEVTSEGLREATHLGFAADSDALGDCNVFIVTVPTPIDDYKRPDLSPLESASRTVGL
jgi:UDP-N-acetyl-D-galactosamine dehydrogenase